MTEEKASDIVIVTEEKSSVNNKTIKRSEQLMKTNNAKMEIALARAKMSSSELSKATGISRASIGRMITGAVCKPSNIGIVAEALGVDVTDLIDMEQ